MRLRMGKDCLSAGPVEGELGDDGAVGGDLVEELRVLGRGHELMPVPRTAIVRPLPLSAPWCAADQSRARRRSRR